jgi:hypothetical protein
MMLLVFFSLTARGADAAVADLSGAIMRMITKGGVSRYSGGDAPVEALALDPHPFLLSLVVAFDGLQCLCLWINQAHLTPNLKRPNCLSVSDFCSTVRARLPHPSLPSHC